ncbi:hypothetical protein BcabD6B2_59060 (apicoplast) [Babesia caballi]|uniref:DNA-directed RNA polymerase n=1 Tax=Babesia caballi TaxID=5871 RepID=A0AAV4M371_BABCB|nr:hypothetical protein BcabD6B2_59060 [Babesia caballi]
MYNNKNFKFISLTNISYIEKYLKEIVNLCFEYSSIFPVSYDLNSFKTIPLYNTNTKLYNISNVFYLLNLYLEKDCFFSSLFFMVNLGAKLKPNQLFQITNIKGVSSLTESETFLLSNLYYGLNLKDIIYSSFSSRSSIIDSSLNTSESGYLTRKLVESLRDLSIKCNICFTKYTYKNTYKNIYINIPFLCSNNKSVCLKCMSVDYDKINISGYSKGVVSGQALGEPSTQMLLRTFHLGDKIAFNNLFLRDRYINKNNKQLKYSGNCYSILSNLKTKNIGKYLNIVLFKYNTLSIYSSSSNIFSYLSLVKILNNLWGSIHIFKNYSNSVKIINNIKINNNIIYSIL